MFILTVTYLCFGSSISNIYRRYTSNGKPLDGLSQRTRQSLSPLVISKGEMPPDEFCYRYILPSNGRKRAVFVTVPSGTQVLLNGEGLEDIIQERENTEIFSGHLHANETQSMLEIISDKQIDPIIEFADPLQTSGSSDRGRSFWERELGDGTV